MNDELAPPPSSERNTSISVVIQACPCPHLAPAFSIIVPLGHVTATACPGGGCPLRYVPSAGAPALLRTRDARVRGRAIAFVRWAAGHRAHARSRGAGGPMVRQPLRAARTEAAAVHRERSTVRPCDRDRAVGPLQCHPEARRPSSNAAGCFAVRSKIATSGRFSTRLHIAARRGERSTASPKCIEILRVAALSTYENQPISTGVLLLEGRRGSGGRTIGGACSAAVHGRADLDQELLPARGRCPHRVPGGRDGRLVDIVDMERWARAVVRPGPGRALRRAVRGARRGHADGRSCRVSC